MISQENVLMTNSDGDPRAGLLLGREPFHMKKKWCDSKAIFLSSLPSLLQTASLRLHPAIKRINIYFL